jgi:hypothetical protein
MWSSQPSRKDYDHWVEGKGGFIVRVVSRATAGATPAKAGSEVFSTGQCTRQQCGRSRLRSRFLTLTSLDTSPVSRLFSFSSSHFNCQLPPLTTACGACPGISFGHAGLPGHRSQISIPSIRILCGSPLEEISMFAVTPSTASFDDSRLLLALRSDAMIDDFDLGAPSADGLIAIELEVEEIVI